MSVSFTFRRGAFLSFFRYFFVVFHLAGSVYRSELRFTTIFRDNFEFVSFAMVLLATVISKHPRLIYQLSV